MIYLVIYVPRTQNWKTTHTALVVVLSVCRMANGKCYSSENVVCALTANTEASCRKNKEDSTWLIAVWCELLCCWNTIYIRYTVIVCIAMMANQRAHTHTIQPLPALCTTDTKKSMRFVSQSTTALVRFVVSWQGGLKALPFTILKVKGDPMFEYYNTNSCRTYNILFYNVPKRI